jgi:hypothetical protein
LEGQLEANQKRNDVKKSKPATVNLQQGQHQKQKHPRPQLAAPWKPGQSGNPAGRPMGSRNKFTEDVIQAFAVDWAAGGPEVIARVRQQDPSTYLRVIASILPKDLLLTVQPSTPGNLDPDEWRVLVDLVKLIAASSPSGAKAMPSEIGPVIEEAVRCHFAKPIEQ